MADLSPERRLQEALGEDPWAPPLPLSTEASPCPFPLLTAFPPALDWLREFVRATAHAKQVPVDLPAALLIAVGSLTASRKIEVEPQPGWREPMPIWSLVVLPSGERKSATFDALIRPVRDWCRDRAEAMGDVCATHASKVRILNAKLAAAEKRAARQGPGCSGEAENFAVALKELTDAAPRPPRLVASDATPQAVGLMLARNDERALVASAEAAIVEVMLGRYSDGRPDLDLFLSAHAGDSIEIERVGREPVRLERPALSVALAVQPEAVRDLYESRVASGRGLLARFQTVWPAPMVGRRELQPTPVPAAIAARYDATIRRLLDALPAASPTAQTAEWQRCGRLPRGALALRLDAEANELMLEFRAQVEIALGPEAHESASGAWLSKLPGTVARIAGVLHAFAYGIDEDRLIAADTMRAAIAWGDYLWQHARHVDHLAGIDQGVALAERILRWLRRQGHGSFSKRDAFDACRGALCKVADQMDAPLALLVERGWTRPLEAPTSARPNGGRSPSPRFEVNPAVHDPTVVAANGCPPPQNPQNPHNLGAARNGVSSAGSAGPPGAHGADGGA